MIGNLARHRLTAVMALSLAGLAAGAACSGGGDPGDTAGDGSRPGSDSRATGHDGAATDAQRPDAVVGDGAAFPWPTGSVSAPWQTAFVTTAVDAAAPDPGTATAGEGTFALSAAGRGVGVGATDDEHLFVYRPLSGDGRITARVAVLDECLSGRVTFGVMMRAGLEPEAPYMLAAVLGPAGAASQYRLIPGDFSRYLRQDGDWDAPLWVRVERKGDIFTAAYSTDQSDWIEQSRPIGGPKTIQAGLVATSHDGTRRCRALFDNVTVTGAGI